MKYTIKQEKTTGHMNNNLAWEIGLEIQISKLQKIIKRQFEINLSDNEENKQKHDWQEKRLTDTIRLVHNTYKTVPFKTTNINFTRT